MPLTAGTTIGPYKIDREIGRGGMGVIFLAKDTRLGRTVALKALPDDVASDPDRLQRFEREARVLASLSHPNIAAIYGLEESEGRKYLALEYIEGETLADRIGRGAVPLPEALDLCIQIAQGMEAAHDAGVVHRDLKPANVMITNADQVKILDFGLAKGRVATDESGLAKSPALVDSPATLSSPTLAHSPTFMGTMPGMILGTAAYLSPEQARGKIVDRRTDIWSFGCVLYECLTGHLAFQGETVSDTIAKILERPMDWSALPKQTPPRLRELLERCLERDPKRRLRDMGDARITLEEIKSGRHAAADHAAAAAAPANPRRTAALIAAAAILGATLGALGWGALHPRAAERVTFLSMPLPRDTQMENAIGDDDVIAMVCRPVGAGFAERATSRLYIRRLDEPQFEMIRGTEGATSIFVSPDHKTLEYWAPAGEQTSSDRRYRMPVDRSTPPVSVGPVDPAWDGNVVWLKSGDLLLSSDDGLRYVRLPANGGPATAPVRFQSTVKNAQFYPVGRPLPGDRVFLRGLWYEGNVYRQGIAVLEPKSGKVKVVLQDGGSPAYKDGILLFSRMDAIFAARFDPGKLEVKGTPVPIMSGLRQERVATNATFGMTPGGTLAYVSGGNILRARQLVIVDRQGKVSEWSPERRGFEYGIEVSPDGSRVTAQINNADAITELWISKRGEPTSRRVRSRPGADVLGHIFSADGRWIAFAQNANDPKDGVYVTDADGVSEPRLIVNKPTPTARIIPFSWASDGTMLTTVADSNRVSVWSARVSPQAESPATAKPVLTGNAVYGAAVFSPDERLVAYQSTETGSGEVYVIPWAQGAPAGQPIQVSRGGGQVAIWSHDGKQLFFANRGKVMSVTLSTTPRLSASVPAPAWDLQALRVAPSSPGASLFDLLPDGRLVAVQQGVDEQAVTQVQIALHFDEVVKKKLRAAGK
jgi:serine/threonine-protein kinase